MGLYLTLWYADNIPDFQSEDGAGQGVEFRWGQEHFVCNSCLQPWNNLANTMLNKSAILIYHLTWALKLTCRDIYRRHIC